MKEYWLELFNAMLESETWLEALGFILVFGVLAGVLLGFASEAARLISQL